MEWAPVTAATGALGPVIAKLSALLGSEYKLRWRTRRDIKFIRSKLKPVHSILWNIWEREELDAASKALKLEALDLADDVEDAIHDFMMKMERSRSKKRMVQTKIKASHFKNFKKRASGVSGRCRSKWKENEYPGDNSNLAGKPRSYPFVRKDVSELVYMAQQRDILIHYLGSGKDVRSVFIYGIAGMGKTTIADLVYEGTKDKFKSRAFVSVARPGGDMREVLSRILEQVAPNSSVPLAGTQASTEEHLIKVISNFLKDKRYLIIIDEIWNWREWEIIKKCLPENKLGSGIVKTTRISAIADKWRSIPFDLPYEMLPKWVGKKGWVYKIGQRNSVTGILHMKADLVGEGFDYEHPIVDMCGGTPLALLCMLSAVAKELEKQGEHAKICEVQSEIENHVMENGIQNTPGFEAMVESLQLGYDDLPQHMLKTCLLYCSIYPDGHSFYKDDLVRRWISERFVYTEEEGKSYIEELLNRGLILPCSIKHGNLRMHPMIRLFLQWKSRQDNFFTCSSEITPSSSIRRLCICNNYPRRRRDATGDPLSALDWYHIRSLVVYKDIERVPFEKLEGVRVLDLCWIKSLPDHQLKHICGLVRLRHLLGLRISELPPEIVKLQCLESFEAEGDGLVGGFIGNLQQLKTLELRGEGVTKLPREIGALHQLHTLRIRDTHIVELPKEIGELQQLKTLDITDTKIIVLPKEIGKLQQLEHLLMAGTNVANIPRKIRALKELKTLRLDSRTVAPALPLEVCTLVELPECIHQALNKSGVVSELAREILSYRKSGYNEDRGGLVVGAKQMNIPRWIREHFNDLDSLDIRICKLDEQGLEILREMPKLVILTLRFEVVPRKPVVISSQGFAMLRRLTVDSRVPRVTFQEGAMPELEDLTFLFQFYAGPPYKDPVGINHLRNLFIIKFECNEDWYGGGDSQCIRHTIDVVRKEALELSARPCGKYLYLEVGRHSERINRTSPPHLLEMEQQREMEEEEVRSSVESEIKEEDEEEDWSSEEGEIEEDIPASFIKH